MKVALPIHQGRISPLLDTATQALLVEMHDGNVVSRVRLRLPRSHIFARIDVLLAADAEALVCGVVSEPSLRYVLNRGLRVWLGVAGEAEAVIASLARNGTVDARLRMPGNAKAANRARPWTWLRAGSQPEIEKEEEHVTQQKQHANIAGTSRNTG